MGLMWCTSITARQVTSIDSQTREAADLPVQAPSKYELVINRKNANAQGIAVPPAYSRADEIIK